MTTPTYTLIGSHTLGAVSSFTLSSIPQNFQDLSVVITGRVDGDDNVCVRFNSSSSADYNVQSSETSPFTSANAGTSVNLSYAYVGRIGTTQTSSTSIGTAAMEVLNYTATDKHKTFLARGGGRYYNYSGTMGIGYFSWTGVRWASFAAINSITIFVNAATFIAGTTIEIYGIEG
jgi:uncharacterized lipoprotein YehR (DUF1307 family)